MGRHGSSGPPYRHQLAALSASAKPSARAAIASRGQILFGERPSLGHAPDGARVSIRSERNFAMPPTADSSAGPLKMRHVGYCTQDGPEVKTGEITVSLTDKSRITAKLLVGGLECSYSGREAEAYTGSLKCPDRRAVPLMVWLKPRE